jgi:hypothetical protein
MPFPAGRRAPAVLACLAVGLVAGCARADPVRPGDRPPESALVPTGSTARAVDYRCSSGRRETIRVDVPDARRLDVVLNPIQLCEFDGGLVAVDVLIGCTADAAPVPVHVVAVHGRLPASTGQTVCGP